MRQPHATQHLIFTEIIFIVTVVSEKGLMGGTPWIRLKTGGWADFAGINIWHCKTPEVMRDIMV